MTNQIEVATPSAARTGLKARFHAWIAGVQKTRLQQELRNHAALTGMMAGLSPDMVNFDFSRSGLIDQDQGREP